MDKDLTVGKLKLNIEKYHITLRQALEYAWTAGYDQRGKELTAHNKKKIVKYSDKGTVLNTYDSIKEAMKDNKCSWDMIYDSVTGKIKRTRKNKNYFRYAK